MRPTLAIVGLALLFVLGPNTAHADEPAPSCPEGSLVFDGLSAEAGPAGLFREDWLPRLTALAQCVTQPGAEAHCLEVQGQFDDRSFSKELTQALGGELAAQAFRAQGRAQRAMSELGRLGVRARQLVYVPAGEQPTFRGVVIKVVPECLARATPAPASAPNPPPERIIERHIVHERIHVDGPPATIPEDALRGVLEAGLGASVTSIEDRSNDKRVAAAGLLGIGGAIEQGRWYGRAVVAGMLGSEELRTSSFETRLSVGPRIVSKVSLGVLVGHRVSSRTAFGPWLEQLVFAGIESTQCPFSAWSKTALCVYESFGGGMSFRRAEYDSAGRLRVLEGRARNATLLAGVGMLVRYAL